MSYYRITFPNPNDDNRPMVIIRCASSIWHAIDLIYSKHRYLQPDRTQYKASPLS